MNNKRKTTEQFINEAKKVHGDRYSYDSVIYINNYTKVKIYCYIHGYFEQRPSEHLKGYGCKKCSDNERKLNLYDFIEKAKVVHGDKYDYSKVIYKNYHSKVEIICKKHGSFLQTPAKHLKGQGCPKCKKNSKTVATIELFKQRCNLKFNNKYNYDLVNFKSLQDEVIIICPIHGEFKQKASYHINGCGCIKCANELKLTKRNDFIGKAQLKHNNFYNYDKFIYVNSHCKGIITCPIHGDFEQAPKDHIGKYAKGCPKCGNKFPLSNKEWIEKANRAHNGIFDYSLTKYVNDSTDVIITCPIHGNIKINPNKHLYTKSGCLLCSYEKNVQETKLFNIITSKLASFEFKHNCFSVIKKQELDIYSEKYKVAIEYQGMQHFKPIDFFGGYERFIKTIELDSLKVKKCEEQNIKLFHFSFDKNFDYSKVPYKVYLTVDELINEIKKSVEEN